MPGSEPHTEAGRPDTGVSADAGYVEVTTASNVDALARGTAAEKEVLPPEDRAVDPQDRTEPIDPAATTATSLGPFVLLLPDHGDEVIVVDSIDGEAAISGRATVPGREEPIGRLVAGFKTNPPSATWLVFRDDKKGKREPKAGD